MNALRFLAVDATNRANSRHPGTLLDIAPVIYRLYTRHLRHDPADPAWPDRDRFVLSGDMRPWCSTGRCTWPATTSRWRISARFAQLGSRCAGHPARGLLPGVEVTTGPLGQGVANAVGMAMAERLLTARFNTEGFPLVDHRTIAKCGDGAMMEGVASEACSLAGHLGLGELTLLYDDNRVSLLGVVFPPPANPTRRDPATGPAPGRGVEEASPFGWSKLDRPDGGPTTFGASGKGPDLYRHFGLTPEAVAAVARQAIGRHPSAHRAAQEHR